MSADGPTSERTTGREVLGTALRICRRHASRLALIGLVLFAPLALLEASVSHTVRLSYQDGDASGTVLTGTYLGLSLLMLGSALCAGLLDRLVGSEFGHEDMAFGRTLRTLPYGRLVGVDLLQAAVVGVGSILGFIPGLVAFTLTCLAGSLVMIETRSTWSALRRSVQLTRKRFGLTILVVAVPVAVEHQAVHAVGAWLDLPFLSLWAVHAATAIVLLVPVVVVEVTLAHHLLRDEASAIRYP